MKQEISEVTNALLPIGYTEWRKDIEQLIELSKLRTMMTVNTNTLTLYWNIGKQIIEKQQEHGWGKHVITQLSKDLAKRFPDDRGYSERNLGYMKQFAQEYPDFPILQVPLAKLQTLPMGVAQYETEKLFADVASALPQIEEIEKGIGD